MFVSCPHLFRILSDIFRAAESFPCNPFWNSLGVCSLFLLEFICGLARLVIWILSIFVSWAAFRRSRNKAYIFILAYFLLPLVVTPVKGIIHQIITVQQTRAHETQRTNEEAKIVRQPPPTATVPAKTLPLYIPIGEFLLLAGVWYLYKKEEAVDGDSSKQTHSALGTPQNETNYQDRLERSYWAVWIVILVIGIFIVTAHTVQLFIHGHCSSPPSDTWKLKYDPLNSDTHSTVIIHKDTNTPYAGYLNNKPHYWQPPTNSQEIHNDAKAELVTNITFQVTATTNAVSLEPPWSTNSHF